VGRLSAETVQQLRNVRMDSRHSHLNELMDDDA
jgi:hypothetical protein